MDTNIIPSTYKGIPDIIWYYLIAADLNGELTLSRTNARDTLQAICWKKAEDFSSILSIWVLSGERSSDDTVRIWNTLFDCGFEQVALDSGFKCDAFLRNELIRITLKHKQALRQHFQLFMRLCSLGKIEKKLFFNIICVCIDQCKIQLKKNTELFTYMLLQNYQNMSWDNVLGTLSYLSPIQKIGADVDFLCRLGRDLGRTVAQKAVLVNQLDIAVRKAYVACNGPESNQTYFVQNKENRIFPIDLFDGFCSDFCNIVIQECGADGYTIFSAVGWYTYNEQPNPNLNQFRRNLALTFALAHQYRYFKQFFGENHVYVKWYESKLVKGLSKGTIGQKKFALHLIIHTELKENYYQMEKGGILWNIADEFRRDQSLRNVLRGITCRVFFKSNFDDQPYSRGNRGGCCQPRGRKKKGRK